MKKRSKAVVFSIPILLAAAACVYILCQQRSSLPPSGPAESARESASDPVTLVLQVKYDDIDHTTTLGNSMTASADESFTDLLQLKRRRMIDVDTFTFEYHCETLPEKIYVKPPSLLIDVTPDPEESVRTNLNADTMTASYRGEDLFSLQSVETEMADSGTFRITVTASPSETAVPIEAKLCLGDVVLDEEKTFEKVKYTFHDPKGFASNVFTFVYHADGRENIDELMKQAVFVTETFTYNTNSHTCSISSDLEFLEIIVK